jgi:hypothetical protein
MVLRGATEAEVVQVIRGSEWEPAKRGKLQSRQRFDFNLPSPITQQNYRFKTIEAIFIDEPNVFVVVTVKVYYSNEELTV